MSYTIVTSFVLQKKDLENQGKIQDYLQRFEYIKNLNIPTILFLDKSITMTETDSLKIIPTSLEDTWIYTLYENTSPVLPSHRNVPKDIPEYLMIQNSKIEWIFKASKLNTFNTEYFVWVDFGIAHVIKNKDNFNVLKNLKLVHNILISAITSTSHDQLTERICWRFAGGVLALKGDHAAIFYKECQNAIQQIFPRLTWEVNIWCFVEKLLDINVYYADHNDSILLNIC